MSEVEKADQVHEILVSRTPNHTTRELADKLGVDHSYIVRLLQLHNYPTEVKEAVREFTTG